MLVHLASSIRSLKEDQPYLEVIIKTIHDTRGVLSRDWAGAFNQARSTEQLSHEDLVRESLDAIKRSDVVIVEASAFDFKQGFFVSYALQHKKPTLIIARGESQEAHLIGGFRDKLLTFRIYKTEEDLAKLVSRFIRANTVATKDLRFNFFIDRPIYNFLREMSYETGKNKSEIIRELLEQEIKRRDK